MPHNWDDHAGWERYYRCFTSKDPAGTLGDFFELLAVPYRVEELRRRAWSTIWFPGCGMSYLPRIYAALGFDVWASDVSPAAIQVQRSRAFGRRIRQIVLDHARNDSDTGVQRFYYSLGEALARPLGQLQLFEHDFRQPFLQDHFDFILNVQAFQGLRFGSRRRAAEVHYRALKPGGHACFNTLNVNVYCANAMEHALVAAGFYIPNRSAERDYRDGVSQLGYGTLFWDAELGFEPAPEPGLGPVGRLCHRARVSYLRLLRRERTTQIESDAAETQRRLNDGETKVARTLYSTG